MARLSSAGRICVVAASKNTVSSGFFSAASRSVDQRAMPCAFARRSSLPASRPSSTGSGMSFVASWRLGGSLSFYAGGLDERDVLGDLLADVHVELGGFHVHRIGAEIGVA